MSAFGKQARLGSEPMLIGFHTRLWPGRALGPTRERDATDFHLANVRDIHLGKAQDGTMTPGSDRGSIMTFAVMPY